MNLERSYEHVDLEVSTTILKLISHLDSYSLHLQFTRCVIIFYVWILLFYICKID